MWCRRSNASGKQVVVGVGVGGKKDGGGGRECGMKREGWEEGR